MSDRELEMYKDRCRKLLNNEDYETNHFVPQEILNFLNLIKLLQQKIDKAIMELDDPFEDEDEDSSWHEKADIYKRQINKAISILKGDE